MIFALLILIVLILLFGAATIKGWVKGIAAIIFGAGILLLALGFVVHQYNEWQEFNAHQRLIIDAKTSILKDMAQKANVNESRLVDVVPYDQDSDLYLCSTISGTSGYGGQNGRRRILSDGGNTELEKPNSKSEFDQRVALHCTTDPSSATMR